MIVYVGNNFLEWETEEITRRVEFKELIKVYERSRWIPCSEKLPPHPEMADDGYIVQQYNVIEPYSAYWSGMCWTDAMGDKIDGIIAWMELPPQYRE